MSSMQGWPRAIRFALKLAIAIAALCCAVAAFIWWMMDPLNLGAPRDDKLIAIFQDNRPTFEELRVMAIADAQRTGYINWSEISGDVSWTRKNKYWLLLAKIGHGVKILQSEGIVRFVFAGGGLLAIGPGWLKGIEYVPVDDNRNNRRAGRIVENNLDQANVLPPGVSLRRITDNWFILY